MVDGIRGKDDDLKGEAFISMTDSRHFVLLLSIIICQKDVPRSIIVCVQCAQNITSHRDSINA